MPYFLAAALGFLCFFVLYAVGYALCVWFDKHPAPYGRMGTWPVEVPVTIRDERGNLDHLTFRGGVAADLSYGSGYSGKSYISRGDSPFPPATLDVVIGRSYLRKKLNSGEWTVEVQG